MVMTARRGFYRQGFAPKPSLPHPKKGERVTVSGTITSATWKRDKNQKDFLGIVVEAVGVGDGPRYWFRIEEAQREDREAAGIAKRTEDLRYEPLGVAGYISGCTDDGRIVFLEDTVFWNPRADAGEIREYVAQHFRVTDEIRSYNAAVRQEIRAEREQQEALPAPIRQGTFTVVFNNDPNDYETVRIKTQPLTSQFAPGRTIAQFLSGPDNTYRYSGFGFVNGTSVALWNRFKTGSEEIARKVRAVELVLGNEEARAAAGEAYAMASGSCCVCGRKLTVPASLNRGMGPECASKGW